MSDEPSADHARDGGVAIGDIPWWPLSGIGFALIVGIAAGTFFIVGPHHFAHDPGLRLNVIKVWLTLVAGYGAGVTLWLSLRRQAHHERDSAQQRDLERTVVDTTRTDAADRRDAELYVAATTQLASLQPAVRLAGLYSFDRLGGRNGDFRQTITDVLCAYLRMPPPAELIGYVLGETTDITDALASELEVRLTAQRLLVRHRIATQADLYWGHLDLDVDLSRAHLHNYDAAGTTWSGQGTLFDGATFSGVRTSFRGATFSGERTSFDGATFRGESTSFLGATFRGESTSFLGATFRGERTEFGGATFSSGGSTWFDKATFSGERTGFDGVTFGSHDNSFDGATFSGEHTSFGKATFNCGRTSFAKAIFGGRQTSFGSAIFGGDHTSFFGANFIGEITSFDKATFSCEQTWFDGADFMSQRTAFRGTAFSGWRIWFRQTTFSSEDTSFDKATFNPETTIMWNEHHHPAELPAQLIEWGATRA